jgi:hypothetical protein
MQALAEAGGINVALTNPAALSSVKIVLPRAIKKRCSLPMRQ